MSCRRSIDSLPQVGEEGGEGSPGGGGCVTTKTILNGHHSGGAASTSSGLAPSSPTTGSLLKTSSISSQTKLPSISCVVVPSDSRTMPGLMQPGLPRAVSLESTQQPQQHTSVIHPHLQVKESSSTPRNGAGSCVNAPLGSSHSLEIDSEGLPTGANEVDKTEFEALLVSTNNGGTWGSNDIPSELFSPIPPPQPVQPPLGGWSFDFDSSHPREAVPADLNSEKMVMDLSDVDNSFRSTESEGTAAAGGKPLASARSICDNANTDAGSWQEQAVSHTQSLAAEGILPMEKVVIEPSRKVKVKRIARDTIAAVRETDSPPIYVWRSRVRYRDI